MPAAMNMKVDSLALGTQPFTFALRVPTLQMLTHPGFCSPQTTHLSLCNLIRASLPSKQKILLQESNTQDHMRATFM